MLKTKNLKVMIEDKEIIHDVSMEAEKGAVTVIMGPNGSGKSTLAHAIMGSPTLQVEGEILMEGESILDVDVPIIHLPITPGKNITVIAEVIAMNHLLSHYGYDAAQAFQDKVQKHIADKKSQSEKNMPKRAIEYFEGDVE